MIKVIGMSPDMLTPRLQKFFDEKESIVKTIEMTCSCCPEQYDCFDEHDRQIAYIRNRDGFTVDCPDCGIGSTSVFDSYFSGEEYSYGGFADDDERISALATALNSIDNFYKENNVDKVLRKYANVKRKEMKISSLI